MTITITRLAQIWGLGPQSATAAKPKPSPEPKPAPSRDQKTRDTSSGFNGRDAAPEDYERRLKQLGLSPPGLEHRRMHPPRDPRAERIAHRNLERTERRAARDQARADEARIAEVNAGAIDGRNATPDEVRARMAALGIESLGLSVREVGQDLPPSKERTTRDARQVQVEADRAVAREVHRASQAGKPFDARKLTSGELRELLALRGVGL